MTTGRMFSRDEVLHLTEMLMPGELRGVSRIHQAKDTLGLGMALEEYAARFFGNGAYAGGVIEWPSELTTEQAKELVDSWEGGHRGLRRSHRPAVLYGGAKFTPTTIDPAQSQMLDQRRFAVEEVARVFRVPPFMLGVTTAGAVSYSSVEQQMLFFSQHTILPYTEMLEAAFQRLLDNPRSFIKFNLSSLVRADLSTRTEAYSKALLAGFMSVNDVRRLEDLRDVEDGSQYRVPLQNIPVTDAGVITAQQKARAAQALIIAGYTPQSIADYLDLPLKHTGLASVQLQDEVKNPEAGVEAG
jgi:HK97 family phage portal protein